MHILTVLASTVLRVGGSMQHHVSAPDDCCEVSSQGEVLDGALLIIDDDDGPLVCCGSVKGVLTVFKGPNYEHCLRSRPLNGMITGVAFGSGWDTRVIVAVTAEGTATTFELRGWANTSELPLSGGSFLCPPTSCPLRIAHRPSGEGSEASLEPMAAYSVMINATAVHFAPSSPAAATGSSPCLVVGSSDCEVRVYRLSAPREEPRAMTLHQVR